MAGISTRFDRCAPTATNTASKPPSRRSASRSVTRWSPVNRTPSAAIRVDLRARARRGASGRPGCRSASSRRAPAPASRISTSWPRSRQVIGSREPARARADHQHPLAAAHRRRIEQPPALERQIAQEPLDRVDRDRAVEVGAVAVALARVVADPPVDRRERIVLPPAPARPARARPPAPARASPGCSPPPDRPHCTAGADRRTPGARPGPARRASVHAPDPAAA